MSARPVLDDLRVHVKIRIAALWASVMFCYLYADYFGLYVPGRLQGMLQGNMGPLGATTQAVLLAASLVMAIPSVMIFLTLALPAKPGRWLNLIIGAIYTVIILLTMWRWAFYVFYGVIEVVLTGLVVAYAWRWPRREGAQGA